MSKPPDHYLRLRESHPDYFNAIEGLGKAVREAGPVDARHGQLVQLAAAVAVRSEGAVHSHVRRALDAGASPAEIRHAVILVSNTVGFPAVMAALSWVDDIIAD